MRLHKYDATSDINISIKLESYENSEYDITVFINNESIVYFYNPKNNFVSIEDINYGYINEYEDILYELIYQYVSDILEFNIDVLNMICKRIENTYDLYENMRDDIYNHVRRLLTQPAIFDFKNCELIDFFIDQNEVIY